MQRNTMGGFVRSHRATFTASVLSCVRKGAAAEVVPACALLALGVLSLAEEGSPLWSDAAPALVRVATDGKGKERARAAAVEALGVACFVSDTGDLESRTEELLALFHSLFDVLQLTEDAVRRAGDEDDEDAAGDDADEDAAGDDEDGGSGDEAADAAAAAVIGLTEAAVRSWGLLATTVPRRRRAELFLTAGPALRMLLENPELGVRSAAGSALALLFVAARAEAADRDDDAGGDEAKEAAPEAAAAAVDVPELVARVDALAKSHGRHRGKKERRRERAVFRDVAATMHRGEEPSEEMRLQRERFEFAGWVAGIRLAALRRALGSGLNQHFLHNALLSAIFNVRAHVSHRPQLAKTDLKVRKEDEIFEAAQRARDRSDKDKKARQKKRMHVHAEEDY